MALATAVLALSGTAWAATATATYARQAPQARAPYGGSLIALPGSRVVNQCGIGVGWRLANGTTKFLTAGHCVASGGASVRYRSSSGAVAGTLWSYRFGSGRDYALVTPRYRVSQYAYHGGTATKTLIRLDGFTTADVGDRRVCVSGSMRGTSCGWTVSRQVHVIDKTSGRDLGYQTEARHALVNGRCPADAGDSGSTVFQLASDGTWFLGMMSAGAKYSTYCTMSYVTVHTLIQQIGGTPVTRAYP